MRGGAFWAFFVFASITVLIALGGGIFSLQRGGGSGSIIVGLLLIFLGGSLALMLGSLLFIRTKEKNSFHKGGKS